ncbi:MAG: ribose 5-phosphate isomerase B [Deltaproteobacteria bacterium]|nr:ribose 5-phosphate isomerase B [Deltaproteobacteria bacterium]
MAVRLAIACDHGGFHLKQALVQALAGQGIDIVDLGVGSPDPVDYPDVARTLTEAILRKEADFGLLLCGTGIGVSIAANRRPGIRAALCTDPYTARMSREHNDANVLCLGGRVVGPGLAEEIVRAFLAAGFAGGRHARRIQKLDPP